MRKILIKLGMVVFVALFILSGSKVLGWYMGSRQSEQEFLRVSDLVNLKDFSGIAKDVAAKADTPEDSAPTPLEKYISVYEANQDFIGWITIEDTKIDYPVMQTVDDPDFYLKHNFEKEYSAYGVPYVQADCDVFDSDNLIIYGHHMNDGSMFSELCKYTDVNFYNEHKMVRFDTRYSCGIYEIIAVFKTTGTEDGFQYHHFVDAENEQEFNSFIEMCNALSLYETDQTACYGDRLITLSTCQSVYSSGGRFVVVAKQIEEAQ